MGCIPLLFWPPAPYARSLRAVYRITLGAFCHYYSWNSSERSKNIKFVNIPILGTNKTRKIWKIEKLRETDAEKLEKKSSPIRMTLSRTYDTHKNLYIALYCYEQHLVLFAIYLFFGHHFYFPAKLVGGFTLSDLTDKPWTQVSSLLPPRCKRAFIFCRGLGSAFIPAARRFPSNLYS